MLINRKTLAVAAVVLVAAATAARLLLLLERPLWHDELFTLWAARMPLPDLVRALQYDSGPPLFYLAERPLAVWAEAARFDPLVRLLSFVATLVLFAGVARLSAATSRIVFLLLAASSPLLLVYGAEARGYAVLSLLALSLFLLCFEKKEERFSAARFIAAAILAALALGTHYLAIFVLAAAALLLAMRRRWKPLAAVLAGGVLFVPWIPVLRAQPEEAVAWMREPLASSLLGFLSSLGGAGRVPGPLGGPLPPPLTWAGAAVGLALVIALVRHAADGRGAADSVALVLLTMALLLASSGIRPVAFPGRSEMAFLPVWLWAVSRGAESGRAVRWLAAAAVGVGLASSLSLLASPADESAPRRATAEVLRLAGHGDRVIAAAAFYLPARLARDRGELQATLYALPSELALHPGWIPARPLVEQDYDGLEKALSGLAPGRRAFLLAHPVLVNARLLSLFRRCGAVTPLADTPEALVLFCTAR